MEKLENIIQKQIIIKCQIIETKIELEILQIEFETLLEQEKLLIKEISHGC